VNGSSTNLINFVVPHYRTAPSPPSTKGLFQFPLPTSGTVFHHTWPRCWCSRYSDSVLLCFSFAFHIRTIVIWIAACFTVRCTYR